jgi:hypothetical protein
VERSDEAWREVGKRFASWGRHLSEHYEGSGGTVEESHRRLKEAASQIGDELDRAFSALDGTLRDEDAKKNLKDAVGKIGDVEGSRLLAFRCYAPGPKGGLPPSPSSG